MTCPSTSDHAALNASNVLSALAQSPDCAAALVADSRSRSAPTVAVGADGVGVATTGGCPAANALFCASSAVSAFTTVLVATSIAKGGWHPMVAILAALAVGTLFGFAQGLMIQRFELPAFLVTLGGMFFARGMAFVLNMQSIGISSPFYDRVLEVRLPLGAKAALTATALVFLAVFAIAVLVSHLTTFGRNVYALGGNADSARLMGLPVGATRVSVYALNGFCSSLAGVVATFYTGSGNPAPDGQSTFQSLKGSQMSWSLLGSHSWRKERLSFGFNGSNSHYFGSNQAARNYSGANNGVTLDFRRILTPHLIVSMTGTGTYYSQNYALENPGGAQTGRERGEL